MADAVNPIIISMIGAALLVATIHALRGVFSEQPCVVRRQETAFCKRRRLKRQKRQRMAHRRARAQAHLVRTRRTKPCRKARYHSLEWKTDVAVAEQRRRAKMAEAYKAKAQARAEAEAVAKAEAQAKAEAEAEAEAQAKKLLKEIQQLNADLKKIITQGHLSTLFLREKPARPILREKPARPILREKPARPILREKPARPILREKPARATEEKPKKLHPSERKTWEDQKLAARRRASNMKVARSLSLDKSRLEKATAVATARPVGRK